MQNCSPILGILFAHFKNYTCYCSFAQSCLTLCDPKDCSLPGFPVPHRLLEYAQTHVHWVSDAIQPFCPLLSSSPASIFPGIRVFTNEVALRIRWPKCWSFSFSISPSDEYSGLILVDPVLQTDQLRHRVETLLRSYSYSVWEPGSKLRQSGFILQSCLWGQLEHKWT